MLPWNDYKSKVHTKVKGTPLPRPPTPITIVIILKNVELALHFFGTYLLN